MDINSSEIGDVAQGVQSSNNKAGEHDCDGKVFLGILHLLDHTVEVIPTRKSKETRVKACSDTTQAPIRSLESVHEGLGAA